MPRRATVILLAILVVLGAAAAGVWAALPRIAESLIETRLQALGLTPVKAEVSRVDFSGARLEHLSAANGALRIDGAEVSWRLRALAPEAVVIDTLHVTGRWTADGGLSLGPLDALLADGQTAGAAPAEFTLPVPRLVIRNAEARITLPEGTLTAIGHGSITRALPGPALELAATVDAPGLTGRMSFKGTAAGSRATPVSGTGEMVLTANGFHAPGVAGAVDGSVVASVGIGAGIVTVETDAPVTLTLRDIAPALSHVLAGALPPSDDTIGTVPLRLTLAGPTDGVLAMSVSGLDDPTPLAVDTDGLRVTVEHGAARLSITAAGSLRLADGGQPTAVLHDLSARAEGLMVAGVPVAAAVTNADATLSAAGIAAEADVALTVGAMEHADAAMLDARLRLTTEANGTGALYAETGSLTIEGLKPGHQIVVTEPLTLTLSETEAPLVRLRHPDESGGGVLADVQAVFADPDIRLRRDTTAIRATFDRLGLEATLHVRETAAPELKTAALSASGGTLTVDDSTLAATTLEATLTTDGPRLILEGRMQRLPGEPEELAARSPLRPYRLSLTVAPAPEAEILDRLSVALELRDAAQARIASATGWVSLGSSTGRLQLDMPFQVFDPKALRPEHLYGNLGTFANGVTGAVAAEGTLAWGPDGLKPDLNLVLRDLSLTQGFVTLRRINGVIRLTSLSPLHTPMGQTVSVDAIEAGLPLTDVTADFQLDGNRLYIDSASATLAEGQLTADPTSFPTDLSTGTMTLRVRDMRLAPLIDMLEIEGLDAQGALGGEIPLQFAGGDVIINNAMLRNQQPDRVAYTPGTPPNALSGGGESVGLVMEALQDFRYNALHVTVDGRASGELTVTLHIAGYNPAFYDGYPVEFNLSVSGALVQAVQAGMQGYDVPDRIRQRMKDTQDAP